MVDRDPVLKCAARVHTRYGLSVPADIQSLARRLTHVVEDDLPENADAITLDIKGSRTTTILDRNRPPLRKRFTLAHELGHILIPWHAGIFVSHTDLSSSEGGQPAVSGKSLYLDMETEANCLAAELLVPRAWLEQMAKNNSVQDCLGLWRKTLVSPVVIAIRLAEILPPGFVFAQTDQHHRVLCSGRSRGTAAEAPVRSSSLDLASS